MPGFAPLTTERLRLRPFAPGDATELHRLVNDWEVAKNLARVPFPYPRALADEWIASTAAQIASERAWHLAIEADGALVGSIALTRPRDEPVAELGYYIGRRYWGRGFAPEAARRLLSWAFATRDIDRVEASVLVGHTRSQAVLRRIGFEEFGTGVSDFVSRGATMPVVRFRAGRDALAASARLGDEAAPEAPPGAAPAAGTGQAAHLLLVAACALIDAETRVLLARRPEGKPMAGLWEFPGGKLQPGETPEAALIRELAEELGIDVSANCLAPFAFASHPLGERHLLMPLFVCRRWEGVPTAREGQALAWVRPARLGDYAMPSADKPLVALLRDFL